MRSRTKAQTKRIDRFYKTEIAPMPISEPTIELDLTGLKCPLPVLKTQKMLKSMDPKHILQVWTTDPMAAIDIPHFCAEKGYELIEAEQHQMDGIEKLCFTIRNK